MPSLKDLRRRIRTVDNTKLITRAMRSVAASKKRRTQERKERAEPYVNRLRELIGRLTGDAAFEGQPLAEEREVKKRLLVLISADRGLCGAFNATINRYAYDYYKTFAPGEADLLICGRRVRDYFRKRQCTAIKEYTEFAGNLITSSIMDIAKEICQLFLDREYDEIEFIHNYSVSAMSYRPRREILLPLKKENLEQPESTQAKTGVLHAQTEYIFEPDAKTLLERLLPMYVQTRVLYIFADAFSAEHQARMIAMTAANDNCEELLQTLTLEMNKARQSMITRELLDIVGGSEALSG